MLLTSGRLVVSFGGMPRGEEVSRITPTRIRLLTAKSLLSLAVSAAMSI
jgi:hypothetical protein